MTTPIYDFLRNYAQTSPLRLHMPGHKGCEMLGIEAFDLTEVSGADSLYEAHSIIKESEENTTSLFGCPTYFSTEGSSQCIRAMLYLAMVSASSPANSKPLILASRNAHKTFLSAVALLDIDVDWLYGEDSYLSCPLTPHDIEDAILASHVKPLGVYITSPDYLGNTLDVSGIAKMCHKHGVLLLVDNAHGAYLKFLPTSMHPIDLGADMCCDSAHKTLPVLTGGGYLHISPILSHITRDMVKSAMALFGSTSPSYLILASLDMANAYLHDDYAQALAGYIPHVEALKKALHENGYVLIGNEPLKLTIATKSYGYTGLEMADFLAHHNMVCEFADPDFLVLMVTPHIGIDDLLRLQDVLLSIPKRPPITTQPPKAVRAKVAMTPREALLSPTACLPVKLALGRVLGTPTVGCPPAVPIVVSGEVVDETALQAFAYYGMTECMVVVE